MNNVTGVIIAAAGIGVAGVAYGFNRAVNQVADGVKAGLDEFCARQKSAACMKERSLSKCDIS